MTEYTLPLQVAAVRRELALRERAYPRWVANARMKSEKAVFELGVMRAVLVTLERLQEPAAFAAGGEEQDALAHGKGSGAAKLREPLRRPEL